MSRTGQKQAFWNKQTIVKCPLCNKSYKAVLPFRDHLEWKHELGHKVAWEKVKEAYLVLKSKKEVESE